MITSNLDEIRKVDKVKKATENLQDGISFPPMSSILLFSVDPTKNIYDEKLQNFNNLFNPITMFFNIATTFKDT